MILTLHHQSCSYDKPGIRQRIGEQKLGTIRQNGVSCFLYLSQLLIADHFRITLTTSKIVLVQNSAPSIGRWASFSSPRAHHLGILFPFLHISFNRIAKQMAHVGCSTVTILSQARMIEIILCHCNGADFLSDPNPIITLFKTSCFVSQFKLIHCNLSKKSSNISLPYQLLSVLTAMLLTLEQNKGHVDDVS